MTGFDTQAFPGVIGQPIFFVGEIMEVPTTLVKTGIPTQITIITAIIVNSSLGPGEAASVTFDINDNYIYAADLTGDTLYPISPTQYYLPAQTIPLYPEDVLTISAEAEELSGGTIFVSVLATAIGDNRQL